MQPSNENLQVKFRHKNSFYLETSAAISVVGNVMEQNTEVKAKYSRDI